VIATETVSLTELDINYFTSNCKMPRFQTYVAQRVQRRLEQVQNVLQQRLDAQMRYWEDAAAISAGKLEPQKKTGPAPRPYVRKSVALRISYPPVAAQHVCRPKGRSDDRAWANKVPVLPPSPPPDRSRRPPDQLITGSPTIKLPTSAKCAPQGPHLRYGLPSRTPGASEIYNEDTQPSSPSGEKNALTKAQIAKKAKRDAIKLLNSAQASPRLAATLPYAGVPMSPRMAMTAPAPRGVQSHIRGTMHQKNSSLNLYRPYTGQHHAKFFLLQSPLQSDAGIHADLIKQVGSLQSVGLKDTGSMMLRPAMRSTVDTTPGAPYTQRTVLRPASWASRTPRGPLDGFASPGGSTTVSLNQAQTARENNTNDTSPVVLQRVAFRS